MLDSGFIIVSCRASDYPPWQGVLFLVADTHPAVWTWIMWIAPCSGIPTLREEKLSRQNIRLQPTKQQREHPWMHNALCWELCMMTPRISRRSSYTTLRTMLKPLTFGSRKELITVLSVTGSTKRNRDGEANARDPLWARPVPNVPRRTLLKECLSQHSIGFGPKQRIATKIELADFAGGFVCIM